MSERNSNIRVRNPKDYPAFRTSSVMRYSGFWKGYVWRWEQFFCGKTDEEPPSWNEYIADNKNLKDSRTVEAEYSKARKKRI